ncbi:NAD-P-binding protein [Rhodofomes roseus]|uniref:NAD-P-binding protein n=1 Tax=Rhodofomes roseus TaxID=34475 RepID=A0ABQ8K607_9APHY|nr:NAD-P-binding protein [Rhodofomes roseus]KAH9832236.1 NAD-P-binding protein [Rhodofomes roseus]
MSGIGLMAATALENNGAIVYIVGRRVEVLEKAIRECSKHGNMIPLQGDVTSKEELQTMVSIVKARHGYINLLVNNAGILLAQQPKLPSRAQAADDITQLQSLLWNTETHDSFGKTFEVNVAALWFCTVAFLELLHEGNKRSLADGGSGVSSQVLTMSSLASLRKESTVYSLSYTLSKAAATHLGKLTAHYFKDWKIRSNVICPGIFPSEIVDTSLMDGARKAAEKATPVGRLGAPDDMAGLTLFLASKAGSYFDGALLLIDGGRLLSMPSVF